MKKLISAFIFGIMVFFMENKVYAQESNHGKQLWAKSILNEKAPELVVEEWISDAPDTKAKFVLIDFWATWCGPCKRVIPKMNDWHAKYNDRLAVIGISDESVDKIKSMKDPVINYYSANDTQKRLKNLLEVKGIPHLILISPEGNVIWEGFPTLGGHELTEEVLVSLMDKYRP